MRLGKLVIENFKGIKFHEIDFSTEPDGLTRNLTCLVGDNGSGKTTVLQAVALTLSLATRRTRHIQDFCWQGFLPERMGTLGKTHIEMDVCFDQEDLETTQQLFEEWKRTDVEWVKKHKVIPPAMMSKVHLIFENGSVRSPDGLDALNLFLGRYYIRRIARVHPPIRSAFSKVGDIFWFDQYRNLGTAMSWKSSVGDQSLETTGEEEREAEAESWSVGVERLREYLVGWWAYHTSGEKAEGSDYIQTLEQNMERLFPGTSFRGVVPRGTRSLSPMKDFYFLLARNNRVFDIAEMSSGEQSIFSLLYEFVRLNITKSIVLIDELELHLHPPEQQALRAALPALASDCQYLVTTHSSYLADTMSTAQLSRLEGGRRCL